MEPEIVGAGAVVAVGVTGVAAESDAMNVDSGVAAAGHPSSAPS